MTQERIPSFGNPPVVEVVWSVQFATLPWLTAAHTGCFWQKVMDDYPICEEQAPIQRRTEQEAVLQFPEFELQAFSKPPLARQWFLSESKTNLIQLQSDRFCVNWRRSVTDEPYPRYPHMREQFAERWGQFVEFATEAGGAPPEVDQLEMTYVNHIYQGEGWSKPSEIVDFFPAISFHQDFKFLTPPATLGATMIFDIEGTGGRLHVSCRHAKTRELSGQDTVERELFRLDLVARGRPKATGADEILAWFSDAREWIVRGFADLTNTDIQRTTWQRER